MTTAGSQVAVAHENGSLDGQAAHLLQRALLDDAFDPIEALILDRPAFAQELIRAANAPARRGVVAVQTPRQALTRLGLRAASVLLLRRFAPELLSSKAA